MVPNAFAVQGKQKKVAACAFAVTGRNSLKNSPVQWEKTFQIRVNRVRDPVQDDGRMSFLLQFGEVKIKPAMK